MTGKPSYYYKIEEIGGVGFTVSYATKYDRHTKAYR